MTVVELNGKKVQLGSIKVLIENIGPGGLRFQSNIKLPVNAGILLRLQLKVLGEDYVLYGGIIHTSEKDELYKYVTRSVEWCKTSNNVANINTNNTKLKYKSALLLAVLFLYVCRDISVVKGE